MVGTGARIIAFQLIQLVRISEDLLKVPNPRPECVTAVRESVYTL